MSVVDTYVSRFHSQNGTATTWLGRLRGEAIARFAELGFPTTRLEEWKYTSVAALAQVPFQPTEPISSRVAQALDLRDLHLDGSVELVFVNGHYAGALSTPRALPAGVTVTPLAHALAERLELVESHLGRYADHREHAFTALNTAFVADGAFVHLRRGSVLDVPIHLVFVSVAGAEPAMICPRNLIVAEENSEATVIESYIGRTDAAYFTNAVTEVVVGPNASITHAKLQEEATDAFHVATIEAYQHAASRFTSQAVSLGAALARTDINTVMDAEGTECTFDGLYVAGGRQHVDHHTTIDHRKPHGTSRELYKGVLDGRATAVFNGKVYVRPNAQKSDAQQMNKNLLLSDDAVINTKPQLEIFADDVKCSHGATIGRLSDDALFYLRTRGIDAVTARHLLIYAFANELIGRIRVAALRDRLERVLRARLPELLTVEGAS